MGQWASYLQVDGTSKHSATTGMGSVFTHHSLTACLLPQWSAEIIFHSSQAFLCPPHPTPIFLPLSPPAPYHNASRWAEVQLNDKSILPSQEGDLGGRYEEEWPWDHWFIWLPPRGQDTEDFQFLLRLKLTIRMKRKGKCQERGTPFFPGPELQEPK